VSGEQFQAARAITHFEVVQLPANKILCSLLATHRLLLTNA